MSEQEQDEVFSKLLEGVVFTISGIVNPERKELREKGIEMGASYRPDWNDECTLLLCAFPDTPKFKSVKANGGTIVSKGWISDCYSKKKLLDINNCIFFAGKPWKKQQTDDIETKNNCEDFNSDEAKKWFEEDMKAAVSWLEKQEKKPDEDELESVAAEGLVLCLDDTIECLISHKDVDSISDTWGFIPRAAKELISMQKQKNQSSVDLLRHAQRIKQQYHFFKMEGEA